MLRKGLILLGVILVLTILFPGVTFAAEGSIVRIGQGIEVNHLENYDTVVAVGGDIKVDGTVKNDVVAIGGDVDITGPVQQSVIVIGGNAFINEEIKGDLLVVGGSIQLGPQGIIGRDLIMVGGTLSKDPQTQILGTETEINIPHFFTDFPKSFTLFGVSLATFIFIILLIGSVLMALLVLLIGLTFADGLTRSKDYALRFPGKSFLIGLLFAIFFVPISIVLLITIIGIPLLLLFWLVYGILALWGLAVIADILGEKVLHIIGYQKDSPVLRLVIGVVLIILISHIPFIGWFVILLFKIMAIGIAAISYLGFRK